MSEERPRRVSRLNLLPDNDNDAKNGSKRPTMPGRGRPGPAIKVALLGDSSAAGYGVERIVETPGAFFASGLAKGADRRVHLRTYARVGAQSSDLDGQIELVQAGASSDRC